MQYGRKDLLLKLESVSPGLAVREVLEQSSCFVFRDGRVTTFNDEVTCSAPCDLGFEGAVAADPLLRLLQKLVEDEVRIDVTDTKITVKGKRKRAGILIESEIILPVDIEKAGVWWALDPEFSEAVNVVRPCIGTDSEKPVLACIHVTPTCIEATNNYQLIRYPVDTGVSSSCLVKGMSLRHIVGLGMTEMSETESWLHFRSETGLIMSVRCEEGAFPDLNGWLCMEGRKTTLPGGLVDAIEKAEIFSGENADNNMVLLNLRENELRIKGVGPSGWYEERKRVKWNADPLTFSMPPEVLVEITKRANSCFVCSEGIKVDTGKFMYVTRVVTA